MHVRASSAAPGPRKRVRFTGFFFDFFSEVGGSIFILATITEKVLKWVPGCGLESFFSFLDIARW